MIKRSKLAYYVFSALPTDHGEHRLAKTTHFKHFREPGSQYLKSYTGNLLLSLGVLTKDIIFCIYSNAKSSKIGAPNKGDP